MAKLIIPVGVPGSGKSYLANSLDPKTTVIASSDAIRKNLFGDDALQYTDEVAAQLFRQKGIDPDTVPENELERLKVSVCNEHVFKLVDAQVREALKNGQDVFYDATNISRHLRKSILQKFQGLYTESIAYYFNIPLEKALEQNARRSRVVPPEVIERFYRRMQEPTKEEGFSKVIEIRK